MSLTTAENGAVTLSKARHYVCLEAVSDLERSVHVTPMRADQTITEK